MNRMYNDKILKITENRTFENQLEQAIEEVAEFIFAAQKVKRYPEDQKCKENLLEETADMLIMAWQMRIYLGMMLVDNIVDYKLDRELLRMNEYKPYEIVGEHNERNDL